MHPRMSSYSKTCMNNVKKGLSLDEIKMVISSLETGSIYLSHAKVSGIWAWSLTHFYCTEQLITRPFIHIAIGRLCDQTKQPAPTLVQEVSEKQAWYFSILLCIRNSYSTIKKASHMQPPWQSLSSHQERNTASVVPENLNLTLSHIHYPMVQGTI